MRFMKKGKFNAELVAKNIKMFAPVQFQQEWLRGVEACKDVKGIQISINFILFILVFIN